MWIHSFKIACVIAEIRGLRIWYEEVGRGEPIVLLHAGGGSCAMHATQLKAFAAAGYRAISYDRRGYGRTEATAGAAGDTVDDLVALLDHLGLERLHLVGTAAGGIVAFDFALSHPQRVRSLVVANSIGGVQDEDYLALQKRLRPSPHFDALPAELRELGPSYRAENPDGVEQWRALEHVARHQDGLRLPPTKNRLTFARLAELRVPTLLLTGDADLYTPPAVLRLFARSIPGAKSVVIPECGHSAYWEQPERFNREVLDFVAQK